MADAPPVPSPAGPSPAESGVGERLDAALDSLQRDWATRTRVLTGLLDQARRRVAQLKVAAVPAEDRASVPACSAAMVEGLAALDRQLEAIYDVLHLVPRPPARVARVSLGKLGEDVVREWAPVLAARGWELDVAVAQDPGVALGNVEGLRSLVARVISTMLQGAAAGRLVVWVGADGGTPGLRLSCDCAVTLAPTVVLVWEGLAAAMGLVLRLRGDAASFSVWVGHAEGLGSREDSSALPLAGRTLGIRARPGLQEVLTAQLQGLGAAVLALGPEGPADRLDAVLLESAAADSPAVSAAELAAFEARQVPVACLGSVREAHAARCRLLRRPVFREDLCQWILGASQRSAGERRAVGSVVVLAPDGPARAADCAALAAAGLEAVGLPAALPLPSLPPDCALAVLGSSSAAAPARLAGALRAALREEVPVVQRHTGLPLEAGAGESLGAGLSMVSLVAPWLGHLPRLLVVDDDESARQLILLRLRRAHCPHVRLACNGREAEAVFGWWRPQLVLLDQEMPGDRGEAVAARLRERSRGWSSAPRIVLVTGHGPAVLEGQAGGVGFETVLRKPVRRSELEALLAEVGPVLRPAEQTPAGDSGMAALVGLYLDEFAGGLAAMQRACRAGDPELLRETAHRFKGTGTAYGFPVITQISEAIENHARQAAFGPASRLLVSAAVWLDHARQLASSG